MENRNLLFIALLWLLGLISMPAEASAQSSPEATASSLPPGVEINARATPDIAAVGDAIRIDLAVSMPAGFRIEVPKPDSTIGDFTVLDFFPGPAIPESGKSKKTSKHSPTQAGALQRHQAQIIAAAYKTGRFAFPSIRMRLHTADGKEMEIASPPVNIEIRSVLDDKNQNLIDLKKQAEIPERWPWLAWCILAVYILLLGTALVRFLKDRQKRPAPLSPEQALSLIDLAEVDLGNLLARGLPDSGHEKQFYVLLSEIVKRILEAGYEIHTAEQTTSEIVASFCGKRGLESEQVNRIESFLVRCDVVKFAKYIPSRAENEAASRDALQILAEGRKAVGSRQSGVGSGSGF
jgi:hypothetical protein